MKCSLDPNAQGVVVSDVAAGSEAQSIGFQKGDIIVAVNNQKIEKPADLERVAGPAAGNGALRSCAAASRSPSCFPDELAPQAKGTEPVRRRRPRA